MTTTPRPRGNILMVTLIMIVMISAFVLAAMNVTGHTARMTDRSRDYAAAQSAAEGAVEYGFGIWKTRIAARNRAITTAEAGTALGAPALPGFIYATALEDGPLKIDGLDEYGAPVANPVAVTISLASYPGWAGRSYTYRARAKVQMAAGGYDFRVGVQRQFQYSEVPLFQAMFFFEDNLEFYRPAEIIVGGLVHTNATAYVSGSDAGSLTFQDQVSYVTAYTATADPPFSDQWSGWVANSELPPVYTQGETSQLHQVPRMEPLGNEPSAAINTTDANPNNDGMHELIEPPNAGYADPPEFAKRRMFNKAGIRININSGTVTVTGQNGVTLSGAQQTQLAAALTAKTTIYDQREGKNVDVTSLDVGQFGSALSAAGVSNFNNVLYINDTTPVGGATPNPSAVRLINGGVLPAGGLTVASENAVYIQGDYNTGTVGANSTAVPANGLGNPDNTASPVVSGYTSQPAAVIGDAVMLLSNSWQDANSSLDLTARPASNTTYNTAIVSGFMPSGYQPATGAQYGYSGGANNFPRFLENWDSRYCTYYGSMVELFQSKTFTGQWDTGVIYRPPLRRWNFDTSFRTTPPPGTLDATSWSRGTWARY